MNLTLSYDDVLLKPQYSDIISRSEINISADLGKGFVLNVPIISSPMDTVSGHHMASIMSECGATTVLHRYNTMEDQKEELSKFLSNGNESNLVGAAIGISGDYLERAKILQRIIAVQHSGCTTF